MADRRRYTRLAHPLEGRWGGASASGACRIGDIGLGGCFIETIAQPMVDERTVVTITRGEVELTLAGRVAYVESPIGFGMEFDPIGPAERETLEQVIESSRTAARRP